MNASRVLRNARKRAGLTQRELARRAGMKQPAVARIESGDVVPRTDTLDRLLRACGSDLELSQRLGTGIDRSLIREFLRLSPRHRIEYNAESAAKVARLRGRAKPAKP